jgi:hypothetical protein
MEFTFDIRGNLLPPQAIDCSLQDFETAFVQSFEESDTRLALFSSFMHYIRDFQTKVTPDFCIWIDGSFVSNKLNPNDLDMVVLIPYEDYEVKEQLQEQQFRLAGAAVYYPNLDVYTVKYYPQMHQKHWNTNLDVLHWTDFWSKTRKNRHGRQFAKGFIQIKFNNWQW